MDKNEKTNWHVLTNPTILRKQESIQNRPFNIKLCRSRCPNLQNPLRRRNRSFSWTSRPDKLEDLWPENSLETYCLDGLWMWIQKIGKKKRLHEGKISSPKELPLQKATIFPSIHGQSQGCTFYVVHLFILREASFPMERTKLVGVISFQPESWLEISSIPFVPQRFLLVQMCMTPRMQVGDVILSAECWSAKNENPPWPRTGQAKTCQKLNCRFLQDHCSS